MAGQQDPVQGVDMRLCGFGPAFGLADASPFVLKVEAFLRWQGLAYDKVNDLGAVRRTRNRKLPMLEVGGVTVSDSHAIIAHVVSTRGLVIDADLSPAQRAQAYWVARALEEHVYFVFLWMRWWPDETWPQVREALFGGVPAWVRPALSSVVRRSIKKQAWAQGVARYPEAQIHAMLDEALVQLAEGLGEQTYWFGDEVHEIDTLLYAFLAPVLVSSFDSPHVARLRSHHRLLAYAQRLHQRLGFDGAT